MAYPKENYLLMTHHEDSAIKLIRFLLFGCWFVALLGFFVCGGALFDWCFFLILSLKSGENMYRSDDANLTLTMYENRNRIIWILCN